MPLPRAIATVTLCAMIGWVLAPLSLVALSYLAH